MKIYLYLSECSYVIIWDISLVFFIKKILISSKRFFLKKNKTLSGNKTKTHLSQSSNKLAMKLSDLL